MSEIQTYCRSLTCGTKYILRQRIDDKTDHQPYQQPLNKTEQIKNTTADNHPYLEKHRLRFHVSH